VLGLLYHFPTNDHSPCNKITFAGESVLRLSHRTNFTKAKQNDKNQMFLNTILTTGVSRKLMTSLVW